MRTLHLSAMVVVLLSGNAIGGATLKGIIIANELGGPPMANVEIAAVAGANPTASDSLGRFTLDFPQHHAGESIRIFVNRSGYVVVNDVQLETVLPADANSKTLTILLCKEEAREEMARRFYRLKSVEAIEETYTERLRQLQNAQQAGPAALKNLADERERAKAAAEKSADELARTKPGQASELYREAMRQFLDGKIDLALQSLDEGKLRGLLSEAQKKKAEADAAIEKAIKAWLLRGQLLTTQFHFDEAEKTYQSAVKAAPENFEANFTLAKFNQELNRYARAHTAYSNCLELARKTGNADRLAMTLNNLGVLHRDQNRMDEARKAYEEALKIRRDLAQKNPETYLPYVATTLNNLGNLHRAQNRMDEASKAYEEALEIYERFARADPDQFSSDVTRVKRLLANVRSEQ
jgi:tetratricopeptide (TPR) repeat protein